MMNLNKDNLYIFFLRRFYDITSDLDEYTISEINKFGNNMYMLMYGLIVFAFFLNILTLVDVWDLVILLIILLPAYKQEQLIKRLGLDKMEIEHHQLQVAKKRMLKRTLWQTLIALIICLLATITLWRMEIPQQSSSLPLDTPHRDALIFQTHFYLALPILLAITGLVGFIGFYISNQRKISVIND